MLRHVVLYLHLLAAVFWIGEMLFLAAVVGPYSRTLAADVRRDLFQALGRRSRPWAWSAIGVLLVTGVLNVVLMGVPLGDLLKGLFWRTAFGTAFADKLAAVFLLLVGVFYHDVVLAGRSARLGQRVRTEGARPALLRDVERTRRAASWAGRVNLLLALVVVWFGLGLTLGG